MHANKEDETRLQVEYRKPADLVPSKHNTRTHSPDQIDEIARSITAVGFTKPIIIDEANEILAGHGAHKAALQLGLPEVPTITLKNLNEAEKRAYRIADNKLAEKSTWDFDMLAGEFKDLIGMGFNLQMTGFESGEIADLINPKGKEKKEPPMPDLEDKVVTVLGDMWLLGDHRLICGDSTQAKTYKTLMGGRQAQMVFTDPPYGVSYQGRGDDAFAVIENDDKRRGELKDMLHKAFKCAAANAREDAAWYIWHASSTREDFAHAMRDVGLVENSYLIWEKPAAVMGWSDYRYAHEPCFYAAKQGASPKFYGDRTNTTVWRITEQAQAGQATTIGNGLVIVAPDGAEVFLAVAPPKGKKVRHLHLDEGQSLLVQPKTMVDDLWGISRDNGGKELIHPTMKPVELSRRACINSTQEGDVVLDMFSGSGSTIMGCYRTGRIGYAIELDPKYVDATVRRWQNFTGEQAIHADEQISFDQVAKERA